MNPTESDIAHIYRPGEFSLSLSTGGCIRAACGRLGRPTRGVLQEGECVCVECCVTFTAFMLGLPLFPVAIPPEWMDELCAA